MSIPVPSWWPLPVLAIAAGAGALAAWQLKPSPPPLFHSIIVRDTNLQTQIPHLKPTLGEKITKTTVKPTQVAVSEGKPDSAVINNFCAQRVAAVVRARARALQTSANPDSAPNHERLAKESDNNPPPILPPFWGKYSGSELTLGASRSDGSLYQAQFRAKPPLEWVAGRGGSSDTLPVLRTDRWLIRGFRNLGHDCPKGGVAGGLIGLSLGALLKQPGAGLAAGAGGGCVAAALF